MSITTNRVEPAPSGSHAIASTELLPNSPRPEPTTVPGSVEPISGDIELHMKDGQVCVRHANGGGLVALTARVESTVFVAETAAVLGHAVVRGDVRVEDQSVIQDNARVTGRSRLRHESRVGENALLEGKVLMQRHSMVGGRAHLRGMISMDYHAYVGDRSHLFGTMHLEQPTKKAFIIFELLSKTRIRGRRQIAVNAADPPPRIAGFFNVCDSEAATGSLADVGVAWWNELEFDFDFLRTWDDTLMAVSTEPGSAVWDDGPEQTPLPLRVELDSTQLELLDLILFPMAGTNGPWPVWDYVSRELGRQRGEAIDAGKVLRSLPTVPVPGHTYGGPYGLVWRSEIGRDEPCLIIA